MLLIKTSFKLETRWLKLEIVFLLTWQVMGKNKKRKLFLKAVFKSCYWKLSLKYLWIKNLLSKFTKQ